ncbi:MAG: substrate-binding domain-containing protein [Gammaproteobacteria bacterium]
MKNLSRKILRLSIFTLSLVACTLISTPSRSEGRFITLASTTSTQNSGLFDYLLPKFTEKFGIEVRVVAVGTGQALKLGENGDADVLLVHDKAGELKFVKQGYGVNRREVMYNDFVIVGPKSDPAGVRGSKDAVDSLRHIANSESNFISRGDDSGTNRQELRLWDEAGIDARASSGKWYKEVGAGMGATLNTAAGVEAYTLTDRATWMSFKNRASLKLLVEGDKRLFNQYAIIEINPAIHKTVKVAEAKQFADWLVSPEGQKVIGEYMIDGQVLFHPNAAGSP